MLKQKLLIIVAVLTFASFSQSAFEVQNLDNKNIDYVQKHGYPIASINSEKECILVCYSQELQDFCGYLVAYYIDNFVQIEFISYSDKKLEEKITTALLVELEKVCRKSKKNKILTSFSYDENILNTVYTQLGYKKYSAFGRAVLATLRGMASIIMFDGPAKGTFKEKVELYKKL